MLDNIHIYELSMNIGEKIWKLVNGWDYFAKETIGKQLVQSTDSVACNLNGSYKIKNESGAKERAYFTITYLNETKTLITKAAQRKLINEKEYNNISTEINVISFLLNKHMNSAKQNKTQTNNNEIIELKEYNRIIYERNNHNQA
jgi:four helix bundle protein